MNTRIGFGLLLWEVFALALGLTLAYASRGPGGNWDAGIVWGVFLTVSLFGWVLFLLVTGFVDYAKQRDVR